MWQTQPAGEGGNAGRRCPGLGPQGRWREEPVKVARAAPALQALEAGGQGSEGGSHQRAMLTDHLAAQGVGSLGPLGWRQGGQTRPLQAWGQDRGLQPGWNSVG